MPPLELGCTPDTEEMRLILTDLLFPYLAVWELNVVDDDGDSSIESEVAFEVGQRPEGARMIEPGIQAILGSAPHPKIRPFIGPGEYAWSMRFDLHLELWLPEDLDPPKDEDPVVWSLSGWRDENNSLLSPIIDILSDPRWIDRTTLRGPVERQDIYKEMAKIYIEPFPAWRTIRI